MRSKFAGALYTIMSGFATLAARGASGKQPR
jgi:hypothetical protein